MEHNRIPKPFRLRTYVEECKIHFFTRVRLTKEEEERKRIAEEEEELKRIAEGVEEERKRIAEEEEERKRLEDQRDDEARARLRKWATDVWDEYMAEQKDRKRLGEESSKRLEFERDEACKRKFEEHMPFGGFSQDCVIEGLEKNIRMDGETERLDKTSCERATGEDKDGMIERMDATAKPGKTRRKSWPKENKPLQNKRQAQKRTSGKRKNESPCTNEKRKRFNRSKTAPF